MPSPDRQPTPSPASTAAASPGDPAWLCLLLATILLAGLTFLPAARPHRHIASHTRLETSASPSLKTTADGPEDTLCRLDKTLSAALRLHGKRGNSSPSLQGHAHHSAPPGTLVHRTTMLAGTRARQPRPDATLFAFQEVLRTSRPIRAGPPC